MDEHESLTPAGEEQRGIERHRNGDRPKGTPKMSSRRQALALAAAAAAGAVAAKLALPEEAQAGHAVPVPVDVLHLGQANTHDFATLLTGAPPAANAMLDVAKTTAGPGPALRGTGSGGAIGVQGDSDGSWGVLGRSEKESGVRGEHTSPNAAFRAPGIRGNNLGHGAGVAGRAENGPGVSGRAPGENPGVLARSGTRGPLPLGAFIPDCGLALKAEGKTVLDGTCGEGDALLVKGALRVLGPVLMAIGSGVIPIGATNFLVTGDPAAFVKPGTPGSHVNVTLVGVADPVVSWIERLTGQFKIHLTGAVAQDTPFTYMVVNPA